MEAYLLDEEVVCEVVEHDGVLVVALVRTRQVVDALAHGLELLEPELQHGHPQQRSRVARLQLVRPLKRRLRLP